MVTQGEVGGPLPHALLQAGVRSSPWKACAFRLFALPGFVSSCGPSTFLSDVGLLGIGAERLRIHSDILSITHPVFKNADFSKEMSAGAGE